MSTTTNTKLLNRAGILLFARDGWAVFVDRKGFDAWLVKAGHKRRNIRYAEVVRLVAERKLVKVGDDKYMAA